PLRQLLRELAERLQVARPLLPPFGIARAESRRDRSVEQPRLAVDGRAEGAQMPRRDAEAGEAAADRGDLGVALAVQPLAGVDARRQLLLAEEPVAAPGTRGRHEALALEVADLRDRDVGELRLQPLEDGADRQQPRPSGCRSGGHARKVSRYLPICSSFPSESGPGDSMRLRLRYVPL